jgi:hypothetical protein
VSASHTSQLKSAASPGAILKEEAINELMTGAVPGCSGSRRVTLIQPLKARIRTTISTGKIDRIELFFMAVITPTRNHSHYILGKNKLE